MNAAGLLTSGAPLFTSMDKTNAVTVWIEASQFYEAAAGGLGSDFLDDVQRGISNLRQHPNLGHLVGRGLRRLLLRRFPFLIYSVEANDILIIAVAHHGRRPGYWKSRVSQ